MLRSTIHIESRRPVDRDIPGNGVPAAGPALHASPHTVHLGLAAAEIGYWSLDLETGASSRSLLHDRIFGYGQRVEEWSVLHFFEHVLAEDREHAIRAATRGFESRMAWSLECRITRGDGAIRWIRIHGDVLAEAVGPPTRAIGITVDITGRKDDGQAVAAAMERLSEAQRVGRIGDWDYEPSTGLITWSPQVFEIFGRDPRHDPQAHLDGDALFDADSRALQGTMFRRLIETGEPLDYEAMARRLDGTPVHIHVRAVPIGDESGRVLRIHGTVQDISGRKHAEAESVQLANRLTSSLDSMSDAFYTLDRDWRFTFLNHHAEMLLARSGAELLGRPIWDEFPATLGTSIEREYRRAIAENVTVAFELFFEPLGICFSIRAYPSAQGLAVYFSDVTESRRAADALRESGIRIKRLNRVYAVLSQINALIVRKSGRDELFRQVCRVAVELGEFHLAWVGLVAQQGDCVTPVASAGDVTDFFERAPPELFDCRPGAVSRAARVLRERAPQVVNDPGSGADVIMGESMQARGIGSFALMPLVVHGEAIAVFALYAREAGFFDADEMRLLQELAGNISLAIENIENQDRLDYLAYYDPLTGLANRTLFLDRVSQYVRSAASGGYRLAVVLIDLERFKNINDSLGQAAGDAILKQVADWMAGQAGDATLLARVGSNHFAAVLPRMSSARGLVSLIENAIEALVSHPFGVQGRVLRMAAKIGAAIYPDDGSSAETLFQHAEAALKHAKASGDRYLLHSKAMTEAIAGKLTLENKLRRALDNEEFVLHYQPKVNLASGEVTSAEALIRWNDPDTGLVAPGRFIPVLEETGLIHQVGRWAMRRAIEDYLRWCDTGLAGVRIAVNVSSLQLRSADFVAQVAQVLAHDTRAASGLELEITESMVMGDIDHSIASLQAIRALGVTVALDDFGTGFSSLTHMARLPIDTLKIDRAFIDGIDASPEGQALVSMIITLAHSLRHKVVAEGVETAEQARLLKSLGCDEMQGFHFARPVPTAVSKPATWLRRRRIRRRGKALARSAYEAADRAGKRLCSHSIANRFRSSGFSSGVQCQQSSTTCFSRSGTQASMSSAMPGLSTTSFAAEPISDGTRMVWSRSSPAFQLRDRLRYQLVAGVNPVRSKYLAIAPLAARPGGRRPGRQCRIAYPTGRRPVPPESLDTLQVRYLALLQRLRPHTPRYMFQHRLQTRPTHDGSAHVELTDGRYEYVVTERGSELQRRTARDADEVLYWLLCDVTAGMAQARTARATKRREDSRRRWMALHLVLLHTLDPAWAVRKRGEYEALLVRCPFRDDGPPSIRQVPGAQATANTRPPRSTMSATSADNPPAAYQTGPAWMGIPPLAGHLLWQHWPALLACFFAQRVAYDVLLMAAIQLAETGVLLSYAAIAVLIVSQLVGAIAMFLVLRPSMPSMQSATGLPSMLAQRSWLDVLAVALLPFFAYYAAWGLLDGIKRDFILTYQGWVSFERREPLQDILALRGLWIALAVSWALREVSKRRFAATRHGAWSLMVAACEAYWLFVGAAVIARGWALATAWWESRVVHVAVAQWWENPFVGLVSLAPLKRLVDPAWNVLATVGGAVAMPLVWLAIAAIVYGMDLRRRGRLDRHDAHARLVTRRYRNLHPVWKKAVDKASGGWNGKGIPIVNAIRLVLRAGLPALLVLCVGWALLDFADAHAWGLATTAIGPRPWDEWRVLGQPLSLLFNGPMSLRPALFTQLLRVVLLAATFDRAIAGLRAARG